MCIQVIERYAVCRCIYRSSVIDVCPRYGAKGHDVKARDVLVNYTCSKHRLLSLLCQQDPSWARNTRTSAVSIDDTSHVVNRNIKSGEGLEASFKDKTETENLGNHITTKEAARLLSQQSSTIAPAFELDSSSTIAVHARTEQTAVIFNGDDIELADIDTGLGSQSLSAGPELSISTTMALPGLQYLRRIRPCYTLIFLGLLTVLGSLVPALWRSITRNDISGGFTLAQYILGVGIFVVGSMVAIHSKRCECWQPQSERAGS